MNLNGNTQFLPVYIWGDYTSIFDTMLLAEAQDNQIPLRDLTISPAERQLVNDYLVKPVKNYFFPGKKKFCSDNHNNMEFDSNAGNLAAFVGVVAKSPTLLKVAVGLKGASAVEWVVGKVAQCP